MKNIFKKASIIISLLLYSLSALAVTQDFNNVSFITNHDGDTFRFNLGDEVPELFRTMPVRLYGIDTPEVSTKNLCEKQKGVEVRDFARYELSRAKCINLVGCSKDKYFRILCRINYDGKDLTQELLKRNYGYEYYGETKKKIDYR